MKKNARWACTLAKMWQYKRMEKIPAPLLEIAEKLWPVSAFASREAWQAYVAKWLPKITK
jgi:hypothetical protein